MKLFLILVTLFFTSANAQDEAAGAGASSGNMAVSIFTGPLLPNKIDGVTEIQSSWGGRYAQRTQGWFDFYEAGILFSNSKGVELYDVFFSAKVEVSAPSFITQVYAGLDYFMYEANTGEDDKVFGLHIGTAFLIPINQEFFFRTDMKMNFEPGNSLFIGLGLETRF